MFMMREAARDPRFSDSTHGNNGVFSMPSPEPGWNLAIIASDGDGWEHVSVHARRDGKVRTPNWKEMAFVKECCWGDDDVVIQYHPRKQDYVNDHPHVLHLWRPIGVELPVPDPVLVGVPSAMSRTEAHVRAAALAARLRMEGD